MTGKDAWDLIQPHINPMTHQQFNNKYMAEAFCMIYIALKEYDANHGGDDAKSKIK